MRECTKCGKVKPDAEFSRDNSRRAGRKSQCSRCHAAYQRQRRNTLPSEVKAEQMAAYRAGMRANRCAVCGGAIEGEGMCVACVTAIGVLGGDEESLKRAARAVKYLHAKGYM